MLDLHDASLPVVDLMGQAVFGSWKLDTWNEEGSGMRYVRLLNNLEEVDPTCLVFEDTKHMKKMSTAAPTIYGGYVGVMQAWCTRFSVPFEGITPGTVRKFLANDGAKKKDEVPGLLRTKYGIAVDDPDAADALGVLSYVLESGLHRGIASFQAAISQ